MRSNMTSSVIWHHWHWHLHHVIPMALAIAPLHSWGQDNLNNVQHYILGYVIPLVLFSVSHYANSVINGNIPFLTSRWSKWDMTWLSGHVMAFAPASTSSIPSPHLFSLDNWNEVQHDFFGYVMHFVLALASCDADGIAHDKVALVSSR